MPQREKEGTKRVRNSRYSKVREEDGGEGTPCAIVD